MTVKTCGAGKNSDLHTKWRQTEKSIAQMTEVTFNFLNLIYDGMKEENLNFKNLNVQIF